MLMKYAMSNNILLWLNNLSEYIEYLKSHGKNIENNNFYIYFKFYNFSVNSVQGTGKQIKKCNETKNCVVKE